MNDEIVKAKNALQQAVATLIGCRRDVPEVLGLEQRIAALDSALETANEALRALCAVPDSPPAGLLSHEKARAFVVEILGHSVLYATGPDSRECYRHPEAPLNAEGRPTDLHSTLSRVGEDQWLISDFTTPPDNARIRDLESVLADQVWPEDR